ncbi:MAG: hypothetical protein ACYTGZ_00660 [Planctomycetota bacterium]|jgi:hypothetical protein
MSDKPRDILEFLRRTGQEPPEEPAELPRARPSAAPPRAPTKNWGGIPEFVVLHRRQLAIAGVAAILLLVLAFLLGMVTGGGEPEADAGRPVGVWTIRVIEYDNTRNGLIRAKSLAAELRRAGRDEVTIQQLDGDRKLLVTLGSWLNNPKKSEEALSLLNWIRGREVHGRNRTPFSDAYFYRIKR